MLLRLDPTPTVLDFWVHLGLCRSQKLVNELRDHTILGLSRHEYARPSGTLHGYICNVRIQLVALRIRKD